MEMQNKKVVQTLSAVFVLAGGLSVPLRMSGSQDLRTVEFESERESRRLVFPAKSQPFDKSFAQWSAEWWQFMSSLPSDINPLLDVTGQFCQIGQRGPVWFLAGTFNPNPVFRTCSVPEGKALFFPVINRIDVNVAHQTAEDLRAEIAPCLDRVTSLFAEVDGEPIRSLEMSRIESVVFEITVPRDNLFGLDPATYSPAIDEGFYVMLKPLSVGKHTIRFGAKEEEVPNTCNATTVDLTYDLTIVPVSVH